MKFYETRIVDAYPRCPIYSVGDIELDYRFWDCECATDYIHPKDLKFCASCQTHQDGQPDSQANEVKEYYRRRRVSSAIDAAEGEGY